MVSNMHEAANAADKRQMYQRPHSLDVHPILDGRRRRCGRDHLHPLPGFRGFNDPAFNAMHEAANTATTVEEQKRIVQEANMYMVKEHWVIWGPEAP